MAIAVYALAMSMASGLWAVDCWLPALACVIVAMSIAFKHEARRISGLRTSLGL